MLAEENTENRRVWGFWPTAGFGIVIFTVFITVEILVAVVFIAAKILSSGFDFINNIEGLAYNGLLNSSATFATSIICLGLILAFIKIRKNITISEYLSLRSINVKTILVLVATTIGYMLLTSVISSAVNYTSDSEFMLDVYRTSVWPVLFWVAFIVFAPAFEEAFFRGFLFAGFEKSKIGLAGTIIVTALVWSSLHLQYGLPEMAIIFIFGLVLGIFRYKTNSLWSPLLMHSLFNLAATVEIVLYINGIISN